MVAKRRGMCMRFSAVQFMVKHARVCVCTGKRRWKMNIKYVFGETGSGKSHLVNREAGPNAYWKDGGSKWFHGYEGEENVVIEEYRSGFPYGMFLQLLDKWPYKVEVKGGMPDFVCKNLWITSHYAPSELYPNVADKSEMYRRLGHSCYKMRLLPSGRRQIAKATVTGFTGLSVWEDVEDDHPPAESVELVTSEALDDRPAEPVAAILASLPSQRVHVGCMCAVVECGEQNAQCQCSCHDDDSDGETQAF